MQRSSPTALEAASTVSAGDWRPASDGFKDEQQGKDVALLSQSAFEDTSNMRVKLREDQQQLLSLRLENMQLRSQKAEIQQEFRTWATTLGHLTAREARMAEIIGAAKWSDISKIGEDMSKLTDSSTGTDGDNWKDAAQGALQGGEAIGSWFMNLPSNFKSTVDTMQGFAFLVMFAFGLFVCYKYRSRVLMLLFETEEVKYSWQDALWGCISCCGVCWPLAPLGRVIGLDYIAIEVSEIQLGHLPAKGDVYVSIDIGTNQLMNTRTQNSLMVCS
jgi:hypothetical protein